ncbi:MAG: EamA family transporter RarD [Myxococcota bacterium]
MDTDRRASSAGVAFAVGAYLSWGLLPLYFNALRDVPATEILAHRVVWSIVFLAALLTVRGAWGELRAARAHAATFAATTVLLSVNWLLYIWAVNTGHVLHASLGYFVTPLVNVVLGVAFLGERLSPAQRVAVGLAAVGVIAQVVAAGALPWISLSLAATFGLYGLLRKRLPIPAVPALFVEAAAMGPLAAGWLAVRGPFDGEPATDALLVGTGVITAVPLLLFANAARRLRLTTLGLVQYLSPTCQFLLAVLAFGEPFGPAHAVTFGCIWAGLVVYAVDAGRRAYAG